MSIIRIIVPRKYPILLVLLKTKKFYKLKKIQTIIEGENKKYYIFIRKNGISIQFSNFPESKQRIEQYLECLFKNKYIGLNTCALELKNVKTFII